jgi:hypothetical protein
MKKFTFIYALIVLCTVFLLEGCMTTQTATGQGGNAPPLIQVGQIDLTAVAKAAGIVVAKQCPEIVAEAIPYANGLLAMAKEGKLTNADLVKAVRMLKDKIGTKAESIAEIALLASGLTFNIQPGAVDNRIVQALQGFIEGMSVFAPQT